MVGKISHQGLCIMKKKLLNGFNKFPMILNTNLAATSLHQSFQNEWSTELVASLTYNDIWKTVEQNMLSGYCNASAGGSINCNSMCCGRGYRISEKTQKYKCHCQFVYCCSVECKICERSLEICK
uniref:Protein Wnt n=1 Tax=Romanomermis culicivorax TaxID=13658 RepID=A0A915IKF5_ROMCU